MAWEVLRMGLFGKKNKYPKEFKEIYVATGLGVPEGSLCSVVVYEDMISVVCNGQEFVLKISNIVSYEYKMDVEVESSTENGSVLKGMIGGVVFGLPGAIVGSLPKTKQKRLVTGTIIIKYQGNTDKQTIILISAPNTLGCAQISDELKPKVKNIVEKHPIKRIEL